MMKFSIFGLAIMLVLLINPSNCYWGTWLADEGKEFDKKDAKYKQDYIWKRITQSNNESSSYYSLLQMTKLLLPVWLGGMSIDSSMNLESDQFPEGRNKLIHSVGNLVKFKFVWTKTANSLYSGSFKQADYGIARFSSAKQAIGNKTQPGIGFKILRDGKRSGDFFTMWDFNGQDSTNFFLHNQSNHFKDLANIDLPAKAIKKKFSAWDEIVSMVGLSTFSMYEQDGTKVSVPKAPFALVLQPNPELTKKCEGVPMDGSAYGCLSTIPVGTVLYRIYGVADPIQPKELKKTDMKLLGEMINTSIFTKSKFGDEQLQFTHDFMTREFEQLNKTNSWKKVVSGPDNEVFRQQEGVEKYEAFLPAWNGRRRRLNNKLKKAAPAKH